MKEPEQLASPEEGIEKLIGQIREWMKARDNKPAKLILQHVVGMTPNGPSKIFQIYTEELRAQFSEVIEQGRIVPAGVIPPGMPPNGAPRR